MCAHRRLDLLRALCDGQWHASEQLCAELGVGPATLCGRIKALSEWDVEVESRSGRHYRLPQAFVPLDAARIGEELARIGRDNAVRLPVELHPTLDSTNEQLLRERDSSPKACLTECQTAGRGRLGRRWVSPFGANLYLSLKWHFDATPPTLSALSLAVGVAAALALRGWGLPSVALKWPNDILVSGRKLAGILIEQRGVRSGGGSTVVVGIGLNVAMRREQAIAVDQPWTSVSEAIGEPVAVDRNALAARLLARFISALQQFALQGLEPFRADWDRFDALRGRWVRVHTPQETVEALVEGVADDGGLLLKNRTGSAIKILSGEVSVRALSPEL